MAFKKSCGNTIKFSKKNMPHAIVQVHSRKNAEAVHLKPFANNGVNL